MTFAFYRLPDGTVVAVDMSATKGAPSIHYTLADGTLVLAVLLTGPCYTAHRREDLTCGAGHAFYEYHGLTPGTGYRLLCPVCDAAYVAELQAALVAAGAQ